MFKRIQKLRNYLFFSSEDISEIFGISLQSAKVLCTRYTKKGIFIRIKKNFYVLEQNWNIYSDEEFLRIANFLQVPSYISLLTALSYYQVTTQFPRRYYESICIKRSVRYNKEGVVFNFYKFKESFYFGFEKKEGIFIATKEKALVDAIYLYSFGKYKIDFSSLNMDAFDKKELKKILSVFPEKTQNITERLCRI